MQKYKEKLLEAKRLRGESGKLAYQTAKILVEVYNDDEWRANERIIGDDAANEFLSKFSNFGEFLKLKWLLDHFPKSDMWESRSLGELERELNKNLEKAEVDQEKRRLKERQEQVETQRSSSVSRGWGEPARVPQMAEDEKDKTIRALRSKVAALEKQVEELESANSRLLSRIRELQQREKSRSRSKPQPVGA